MTVYLAILLTVLTLSSVGISGTLKRILEVNQRFLPEHQPVLARGDVLLVQAWGEQHVLAVTDFAENEDGTRTVAVAPLH